MKILFVVYDNESAQNTIPLGVLYVASYIKKHGYADIHFYSQDIYRYPESHLTEFLSKNKFDVVGIGFVAGYFQHRKILAICEAINKAKHRPFMVLGGHGPTPIPEFYMDLTKADAVVMGEGEVPFLNLLGALETKSSLKGVKGIAFRDGEKVVINDRQEPIKDLAQIPHPYFEALPMEYYINAKLFQMKPTDRMISMLSGRGCNYSCNFCLRLEKGIRLNPVEAVIDEIKRYIRDYRISFVVFWDELFMISERRVQEFAEAILRENIKINYWCCGRLNIVNDKIIDLMKRSGCKYIDYGIEQFDNAALKAMDKRLTEDQIVHGIELTQKNGIYVAFNIIFGNVGDTRESLKKSLWLLNKYNDYGQLRVIRPVTPYPGTPLYYEAIKKGLLKGPADFYEKHKNLELLTVNFTEIPDDEFHSLLFTANEGIIKDYYGHVAKSTIEKFRKVYFSGEYNYRGARHA